MWTNDTIDEGCHTAHDIDDYENVPRSNSGKQRCKGLQASDKIPSYYADDEMNIRPADRSLRLEYVASEYEQEDLHEVTVGNSPAGAYSLRADSQARKYRSGNAVITVKAEIDPPSVECVEICGDGLDCWSEVSEDNSEAPEDDEKNTAHLRRHSTGSAAHKSQKDKKKPRAFYVLEDMNKRPVDRSLRLEYVASEYEMETLHEVTVVNSPAGAYKFKAATQAKKNSPEESPNKPMQVTTTRDTEREKETHYALEGLNQTPSRYAWDVRKH